jgi:hypothetical protein
MFESAFAVKDPIMLLHTSLVILENAKIDERYKTKTRSHVKYTTDLTRLCESKVGGLMPTLARLD